MGPYYQGSVCGNAIHNYTLKIVHCVASKFGYSVGLTHFLGPVVQSSPVISLGVGWLSSP
jgi:hypothetical protein